MVMSAISAFSHVEDCYDWEVEATGYSEIFIEDGMVDMVSGLAGTDVKGSENNPPSYCSDYQFGAFVSSDMKGPGGFTHEDLYSFNSYVEVEHESFDAEPGTYCVTSEHGSQIGFIWNDHSGNNIPVTTVVDLDSSEACLTIEVEPTPTPTPTVTSTPTPSPTPCFDELNGKVICQLPRVDVHMASPILKPAGTTGGHNTSTVRTCITNVQNPAGRQVQLDVLNDSNASQLDGGHKEDFHIGSRPLGKVANRTGTTDASGCFQTSYTPTHISGKFKLRSTISSYSGTTDFRIRTSDFFNLVTGADYELFGDKPWHPDNHWGTLPAVTGLRQIATDYRNEYYGGNPVPTPQKIYYNDVSLEWGGKFDLNRRWESTNSFHGEHREGINCDTRSNNIPTARWQRLNEIFRNRGSTRTKDETATGAPHWHLRFEFGNTRAVERTPHMFIEDAFDAAFQRESTPIEYNQWFNRITNAKALGSAELLLEAKFLEREIFASAEYSNRYRSDVEFIYDVFWAYLYRDPTEAETQSWLAYLRSLPPFMGEDVKRDNLIWEFEMSPEFQDVLGRLVDPSTSPQ